MAEANKEVVHTEEKHCLQRRVESFLKNAASPQGSYKTAQTSDGGLEEKAEEGKEQGWELITNHRL